MEKNRLLYLLISLLILSGSVAYAQKQVDIGGTNTAPVIDGVADDAIWAGVTENQNNVPDDIDPATSSGYWKATWDTDNFYILVDVTDDVFWDNNGSPSWNTDNLEIYFQMDNERTGQGPRHSHGTQYSFQWNNAEASMSGEGTLDNVEFTRVDKSPAGYVFEVKIPWASLRDGYSPASGNSIAFDVNIVDNDGSGQTTLYWNSTTGLWSNMDEAGTITLKDAPKEVDIDYTNAIPVIDGVANDAVWGNAIENANNVPSDIDPATSSGYWKAAWDNDNMYILVDVTDDVLWDNNGAPSWNTDNLEIYFQMDNERTGQGPRHSHGTQYAFQWNSATGGLSGEGTLDNVEFARVDKSPAGYVFEVKIPWASLRVGYSPASGNSIAFDVNIVDNDDGSGYTTLYWNSASGLWSNMDEAGTITLAGTPTVSGLFSSIDGFGEAANFEEIDPTLWGVIEDSGDTRYGITAEKPVGGNRKSIYSGATFEDLYYVSADVKLFKRPSGSTDMAKVEDAILFFNYADEDNWANATFFNTSKPAPGDSWDPFGLSGFVVKFEGVEYRLKKYDDPGDPVEEIPAETAIPYVDDSSFDDWNNIRLEKKGSIVSMLVNGEEYYAIDFDTLTVVHVKGTSELTPAPDGFVDFVLGSGSIGVGSGNDKVYFDDIEAGNISIEGKFSEIPVLGEAGNFEEINPWLWGVIEDSGDTRYGITAEKPEGGNRKSILKDASYSDYYYVSADVKLFKRPSGSTDMAKVEDAILFFNYADEDNWANATFFNTSKPAPGDSWDPFGLSGFVVKFEGVEYRLKKYDDPGDPVEEIPAESAIPYVDDSSFDEWNNIRLEKKGSIVSMLVNGEEYYAIDFDTLTVVHVKGTSELTPAPDGFVDFVLGSGRIGVGSGNDKVYFDDIEAGNIAIEGKFSEIPVFGEAGNFEEINPWLWGVIEDSGDTRYGITAEKPEGGNRKSILKDATYTDYYYVSADVKLFKRPSGSADMAKVEDAILYFNYADEDNWANATFFNTSKPAPGDSWDPFGLSGFVVKFEGVEYRLKKYDDPGDPVEEIPAETAIPYVDDSSFDDWNNIRLEKKGSIVSMLVNGEEYYAIDFDTLTVVHVKGTSELTPAPDGFVDFVLGSGRIGVGSGNDKVYFDDIEAGNIAIEGKFSEIPVFGEAGNFEEINPWLWGVIEDSGDTRYGITAEKPEGGNRKSILKDNIYADEYFVTADVKLFKRPSGSTDIAKVEDAILFFNYADEDNWANATFFNTSKPAPGDSWDPFGLSGFVVKFEGVEYRLKKYDDPGDPVEEIPAESAIPYVDDSSFDDWNNIRLEKKGSIVSMLVNGEEYYAIDFDTLTVVHVKGTSELTPAPDGFVDFVLGSGRIGVGSGNDKVYFDDIKAGSLSGASNDVSLKDIKLDGTTLTDFVAGEVKDMYTVQISIEDTTNLLSKIEIVPTLELTEVQVGAVSKVEEAEKGSISIEFTVTAEDGTSKNSKLVFEYIIVGVKDVDPLSGLIMFPNPVKDQLNVSNIEYASLIQILSISGKVVQSIPVNNTSKAILNTSGMESGIYLLKIELQNGDSSIKKIIKK